MRAVWGTPGRRDRPSAFVQTSAFTACTTAGKPLRWGTCIVGTHVHRLSINVWRRRCGGFDGEVVADPDIQARLLGQGSEAVGGTPEQLGKVVDAELVKWARLVKEANVKVE